MMTRSLVTIALALTTALSGCARDQRQEAVRFLAAMGYTQVELRAVGPGYEFTAAHEAERCTGYLSVPPGAFLAAEITRRQCSAPPSASAPPR